VVLGLSGGPDSTAMLLILLALKRKFKMKLIAAHLNHQLRGRASDKDRDYVRRLTRRFNVPFYCESIDIAVLAEKNRTSLEETAREARYDFFMRIACRVNARRVAVAHTADDQAETVMMRIIYGTGLKGLAGVKPVRGIDRKTSIKVIRPLIEISRAEVMAFLKEKKYRPRLDASNMDLAITRNRIRHDLLVRLEKGYNPGIKEGLCRLSRHVTQGYDYLRKSAQDRLKKIILRKDKTGYVLDIKRISALHPALRSEVIRLVIEDIKGDLKGVTSQNVLDIEKMMERKSGWTSFALPGGITVTSEHDRLIFYGRGFEPDKVYSDNLAWQVRTEFPVAIKVPGMTKINKLGLKLRTSVINDITTDKFKNIIFSKKRPGCKCKDSVTGRESDYTHAVKKKSYIPVCQEFFDYDKLKFPLNLRLKEPGDRIKPLGLNKTKKVKDIFIDRKVPVASRPLIPLVFSEDKIAWIYSVCISNEFKITANTKKILKITCQKM